MSGKVVSVKHFNDTPNPAIVHTVLVINILKDFLITEYQTPHQLTVMLHLILTLSTIGIDLMKAINTIE